MLNPKQILALAMIAALPAAATAQKKALSVEEAVSLGLNNSPGLHASRMKLEAAAAKAKELAAGRLPSVKFGAGYVRLSDVPPFQVSLPLPAPFPSSFVVSPVFFNNYTTRLSVEQPLFTGFRLEAGTDSARFMEKSAGHDLEKDRAEYIFAVKSAYWALVRAKRLGAVIEENLAQVDAHLKDVQSFFDQGLLTRNEVLRVEVQRSSVEIMKIDAANAADIALTSLDTLIGLPQDTSVEPTSVPESAAAEAIAEEKSPGEQGVPASILATALAARPELLAAGSRIRAAEAGVKAARAGWYPQIVLSGNYYYNRPNSRLLPSQDKFYGTWDIGVSLSLDVWNWGRTKFQTEQAKAELAQVKDGLKLLEDQAVLDVTQSRLGTRPVQGKTEDLRSRRGSGRRKPPHHPGPIQAGAGPECGCPRCRSGSPSSPAEPDPGRHRFGPRNGPVRESPGALKVAVSDKGN